jgi:hypothetical protein
MREASVEMRKPSPEVGEPKNSATMAPISASVALTFSAPKMNGSGRRQAQRPQGAAVARGIAVHQLALQPARCLQTRQRGHQHREKGHQHHHRRLGRPFETKPHHRDGATATSGTVLVSDASGSSPRCRNGGGRWPRPPGKPRPEPSTQPISTALSTVCTKSPPAGAVVQQRLHDQPGRGQQHARHIERHGEQLPEVQHPQTEQRGGGGAVPGPCRPAPPADGHEAGDEQCTASSGATRGIGGTVGLLLCRPTSHQQGSHASKTGLATSPTNGLAAGVSASRARHACPRWRSTSRSSPPRPASAPGPAGRHHQGRPDLPTVLP